MYRIGVSIRSAHDRDTVHRNYIKPLQRQMRRDNIGYWSNHLVEEEGNRHDPTASPLRDHLLLFQVYDFKRGVNFLRSTLQDLHCPRSTSFIDLTDSLHLY